MKKLIATVLTMMVAQTTFAADLYCGASAESTPGSNVYNKSIFMEKIDSEKALMRFLLADGTLVRVEEMTQEKLAKIVDGTKVMSVSFSEGKPSLFIGTVTRKNNEINYTSTAHAISLDGKGTMLLANQISLFCKEL